MLLAAVLALSAQFIISYWVTSNSLDQLEDSRAADRLSVAVNVLTDHSAAFQQLAVDNGSAVVAPHVAARDLGWLDRELVRRLTGTGRVDFVAVLDSRGGSLASSAATLGAVLRMPVVTDAARGEASSSWAVVGGRLWLVAAAPIGEGPGASSVGTIVVGRVVDVAFARTIARATNSQIAFVLGGKVVAITDPAILPLVKIVDRAPAGQGDADAVHGYSGARQTLPLAGRKPASSRPRSGSRSSPPTVSSCTVLLWPPLGHSPWRW